METSTLETKKSIKVLNHSDSEINQILNASVAAFEDWKRIPFADKKRLMYNFADLLDKEKEDLAKLITNEMGKVITQARSEIEKCAATSRFYANKAEEFLAPEIIETESKKSYISYSPLGAVLAIMPWNFPFWQVIRFSAPTLMAGNVAVLKHASNVPGCAKAIEELYIKAGFPSGVFQTLFIEGKNMDSVVADPRIKAVTLTGSEEAGKKVASTAGKFIKKTVLELGGSDPFVVLEDADMEITIKTAVKARMVNTGQSCIAAKRFIVVESVYNLFLDLFKEKMSSQKMGDPFDDKSDYGPLAKKEFAQSLHNLVLQSIDKGAKVLLGGNWSIEDGAYYPATILYDVTKGMVAYEEELFGPVAIVIKAKDETDAIRIANNTRFGLGASIWTKDISKGERLALQIEAGMVFVNKMVASHPLLPFGGVKMSGYGRELSYLGIREFTNVKSVGIG